MTAPTKLTKRQIKKFTKQIEYYGEPADMIVEVRHDDSCGNGHNTFAITGDIYKCGRRTERAYIAGGCLHDEIAKYFPELQPLIKWHLCSTDGPLHYVANSLYHASDKDHNGKRKGEPVRFDTRLRFKGFPITFGGYRSLSKSFIHWLDSLENYDLEVRSVYHDKELETFKPKYTFLPYSADKWHTCPFDTERDALEFLEALQKFEIEVLEIPTAWSNGKEPDLPAARNSAIWPDAKLEDFTKEKLLARLPALLAEFQAAVESLGFEY